MQYRAMLKIALPMAREKAESYANCLLKLGAVPVITDINARAEDFDGLLMPGGGDVNPSRYGQEMNGSNPPDDALDAMQFTVLERFVQAKKPVLGICRGHQLINVFFGGTLIQNLPNAAEHARRAGEDNRHTVTAEEGTFLFDLYGKTFETNTYHHQAVDRPGEGIRVCALAADGTVEGLFHEALPIWAVQFHPERMGKGELPASLADGDKIIRLFLNACQGQRK